MPQSNDTALKKHPKFYSCFVLQFVPSFLKLCIGKSKFLCLKKKTVLLTKDENSCHLHFPFQKLESQLRDVAYGTRQYRIQPPTEDVVSYFKQSSWYV